MNGSLVRTKVLITVMTYPHPSRKYRELVCTAGIAENGEWVRLYPINYRYRHPHQKFGKYQWIEVALSPCGDANDPRKESRKPDLNSIRVLGPPLSTTEAWRARRTTIDPMPHHTLRQLKALYDKDRTSLGIIRPKRVLDVTVTPADPEWKPEWQALYDQKYLFDPPKPLRKLPYTFHYLFECEDSDRPEKAMITDWELGALFLNESARLKSEEEAAESVRQKFLRTLCDPKRDTRFFVGTNLPYNVWLVIGVFWPPRNIPEPQGLFPASM